MDTFPTRKELQTALQEFAKPDTSRGVRLFVIDLVTYILAIILILMSPLWYVKLIASVLAGFKIANLITLAHDAAHRSLTMSNTLNKLLAIISFTPCLFNYTLWLHDHHFLHHRKTNEEHADSYVPLSKQEYDALSEWKKFKYRMYRLPTIWMFGIYYIFERWWKVKLFPRSSMPKHVQKQAWPYFFALMFYLISYLTLLALAPRYSPTSTLAALVYGFVIPYYVFQTLYSFSVFVQHNHYRVPWFKGPRPREGDGQQAYISVHLVFPAWVSILVHNAYDHAAHHVLPSIPCYHLPAAQKKLNDMIKTRAITDKFSFHYLYGILRRCKLYDFERNCWTDYDGRPSTRTTLISAQTTQFHSEFAHDRRKPVYG